jgi:hypothetical protein
MAIVLDSKQVVSLEELLMSQVVQQEALNSKEVPGRNFFLFSSEAINARRKILVR